MEASIVRCQDWRFSVDWKKTQALFSRSLPEVRAGWEPLPPVAAVLFAALGIRPERPLPWARYSSRCYLLFGTAASEGGYELDFYTPAQDASIVVLPCPNGYQEGGLEIRAPCVLLELMKP